MYVDCSTCNYESGEICLIGKTTLESYSKRYKFTIEQDGSLRCPSGHEASLLPTQIKFCKKYIPPKLKNDVDKK